jgi:hypothetical protein
LVLKEGHQFGYIDDLTLVGPSHEMNQALSTISSMGPRLGFNINFKKTKVLRGIPSGPDLWASLPQPKPLILSTISDITPVEKFGIEILGVPVGSDPYILSYLAKKIEKIRIEADSIFNLEDPQAEWLLLYYCIRNKITFLQRSLHPRHLTLFLFEFSTIIRNALSRITGRSISDTTLFQASLPLSYGGCGLQTSFLEDISHAAYLSSCIVAGKFMIEAGFLSTQDEWFKEQILGNASQLPAALPQLLPTSSTSSSSSPSVPSFAISTRTSVLRGKDEQLKSVLRSTSSSLGSLNVVSDPLRWWDEASSSSLFHLQRTFTALYDPLHVAHFTDLIQSDPDYTALFAHLNHPQSGKFLTAVPKNTTTTFPPEDFRSALSHRLHLKLYTRPGEFKCICNGRPKVDMYGSHLFNCNKGNEVKIRHDAVVHTIADLIQQAGLYGVEEPKTSGLSGEAGEHIRPDITIFGSRLHQDSNVHLDVTIRGANTTESLSAFFNRCEADKIKKYEESAVAMNTKFIPLVFEVNGAMSPKTSTLIHSLISRQSERLVDVIPLSTLTHHWLVRISTVLARLNGFLLNRRMDAVQSHSCQVPTIEELSYSTHLDLAIPLGSPVFCQG